MNTSLYAIVDAGIVTGLIPWDGNPASLYIAPPSILVSTNGNNFAQIGATYSSGTFIPTGGIIALSTPVNGATVALPNAPQPQNILYAIIEPAATLSSLTIVLPPNPIDGTTLILFSTKTVTSLLTTGAPINNPPTSMVALNSAQIIYSIQYATWFQL